jgi:hypothetical protein
VLKLPLSRTLTLQPPCNDFATKDKPNLVTTGARKRSRDYDFDNVDSPVPDDSRDEGSDSVAARQMGIIGPMSG